MTEMSDLAVTVQQEINGAKGRLARRKCALGVKEPI